tara:strand:- start:893 stop:1051 length:159 start_codon:yes stop_codon:yes gene_type:complete
VGLPIFDYRFSNGEASGLQLAAAKRVINIIRPNLNKDTTDQHSYKRESKQLR